MGNNSLILTAKSLGAKSGQKNVYAGSKVKTSKVHVGESSYKENIPENSADITIGVFMDGTLNNRANIKARQAYEKADKSKKLSREAQVYKNAIKNIKEEFRGSYANDFSNISRMEPAYKEIKKGKQLQTRTYIEGIGSTNERADDNDGMGKGTGVTGIPKKVEKACLEAAGKITKLYNDNQLKKINMLQIDVFGFSRGAAAARNFAHEITLRINHPRTKFNEDDSKEKKEKKNEKYKVNYGELGFQLEAKGIDKIGRLVIRFVGLYETVASYGVNHTGGIGIDNDSVQLNLNSVAKALHVFHLVAQDEHRENFTLTNINSAGTKGVTKFIPGVHSDIGGGYTDNYVENNLIIFEPPSASYDSKLKLLHPQLITQGWYTENELTVIRNKLVVNKTIKSKNYSYIPLHIMVEYAIKKKSLFEFSVINDNFKLAEISQIILPTGEIYNTTLKLIKARLDKHIYYNAARINMNDKSDEKMLRLIRANYIHTSCHYNNKVIGGTYAPHKPFDSYLTRRRKNDING